MFSVDNYLGMVFTNHDEPFLKTIMNSHHSQNHIINLVGGFKHFQFSLVFPTDWLVD